MTSPSPLLLWESHALWLQRRHGADRLLSLPDSLWNGLREQGITHVWLMGLWRRSPASRAAALCHDGLRSEYDRCLPDWGERDVGGSPFAVADYSLDPALGAPEDLSRLKSRLNEAGLGLIVDFVPNHLAVDHPWTVSHPHRFVRGTEARAAEHPERYFLSAGGALLAHGRDPHFPPWTDTAQLNCFESDTRRALTSQLRQLAERADGVRCDMAMLLLNRIFQEVWGADNPGPCPDEEFWATAIAAVKAERPDFLFLAEAYWGTEPELHGLGFDYTYDKSLYDRLLHAGAAEVRAHILAQGDALGRGIHFVENHDEARAAGAFGPERSRAAAAIATLLPGMAFLHDGQEQGQTTKVPIQLTREPRHPPDPETFSFYEQWLSHLKELRQGRWALARTEPGDSPVIGGLWRDGERAGVVAVNNSGSEATATFPDLLPGADATGSNRFLQGTGEVSTNGPHIHLRLSPWAIALYQYPKVPDCF